MNTDDKNEDLLHDCFTLLQSQGIAVTGQTESALMAHVELVREWNQVVSLVSKPDLGRIVQAHLVDSLSLAPVVLSKARSYAKVLDIGSGAGFPAIPLKIALPDLNLWLIERSDRKVGFLRKVVSALKLQAVTIYHGEFPIPGLPPDVEVVTARAVENPEKLTKAVLYWMPETAIYLCQSPVGPEVARSAFHVERIQDEWSERGLRRGDLHIVTKRTRH